MKKFNLYIPVVLMALSALLFSCQEEIDLELNDSFTRLVVEGKITTDSIEQKVVLSTTSSYFSNEEAPRVTGAQVSVSDGNQIFAFVENPNNLGSYYSQEKFKGIPGATYELRIDNADLGDGNGPQSYSATDVMKTPMYVDSVKAIYIDDYFGRKGYRIFGFAQESPTPGDFYIWKYYINNVLVTDTLSEVTFASDELVNGSYVSNLEVGFLSLEEGKPGDTLSVETNCVSESYFSFFVSFLSETRWSGGGGFSGPPANVETNMNNGAVGFFNTEAKTRISIILP